MEPMHLIERTDEHHFQETGGPTIAWESGLLDLERLRHNLPGAGAVRYGRGGCRRTSFVTDWEALLESCTGP
eukprot:8337234-Pyramimonas_sp.AAC.1